MKVLNQQKTEINEDQKYTLAIFHKEIGTLLGYIFIQDISRNEKSIATLDFRLINIYWGHGFAKEAVAEAPKLKTTLKIDNLNVSEKSRSKLKI